MEEEGYSADELLEHARAQGTPATHRLIVDWVSIGLLDAPARQGRGRGRGVARVWSRAQRDLFLNLLMFRKNGNVARVATLCNVPAFLWLDEGEQVVPRRQLRKALATWSSTYERASERSARASAKALVADLRDQSVRGSNLKLLVEYLTGIVHSGVFDRAEFIRVARRVLDPKRSKRVPDSEGLATAERWASLIEARIAGLDVIRDGVPDVMLDWARALHHDHYRRDREHTEETWKHRGVHEARSEWEDVVSERLNNACRDLVTMLGIFALSARPQETATQSDPSDAPATLERPGARHTEVDPHVRRP